MLMPVIMAGGSGSRLWPASRQLNPKQFLQLTSEQSMLQETLLRLNGLTHCTPFLVCNEEHRFLAAEQLRQLGMEDVPILLEPAARNTAPAIALAALHAITDGNDPVLLVLAADHLIHDNAAFQASVECALPLAEAGNLVTFGVVPTHAETGYGYIQRGGEIKPSGFQVARFVEKPEHDIAQQYVDSGEYFWNSGMFMFRASRYLEELARFQPAILECCRSALGAGEHDMHFVRVSAEEFAHCPEISIDYAVMEKTEDAVVVPLDAHWSDVGSWSSLWEVSEKDGEGNVTKGDALIEDSRGSLVHADHRLVAVLGVDDLIVVETKDAVLVASKDRTQDVKKVVEQLKAQGRNERLHHREVYRPWGHYDAIDSGYRYQVKRITVKPGAKLSVQMHHHRAEHWVVVSGTALVTNGDKSYLVTENESTFIPVGEVHSLENPGVIPLELIEVQSGPYLGEDDIVRLKDQYGRV